MLILFLVLMFSFLLFYIFCFLTFFNFFCFFSFLTFLPFIFLLCCVCLVYLEGFDCGEVEFDGEVGGVGGENSFDVFSHLPQGCFFEATLDDARGPDV